MNGATVDEELDMSGLLCPEPVMLLHAKVREVPAGFTLRVIATDPSTQRDIPRFCRFLGHELLETAAEGDVYTFVLRIAAT